MNNNTLFYVFSFITLSIGCYGALINVRQEQVAFEKTSLAPLGKKDLLVPINQTQETEDDIHLVAQALNNVLADHIVLFIKEYNFHWNVTGGHFPEFHKFFEELYTETQKIVDLVAEQIRAIGFAALGSMEEALNSSTITEVLGKERNYAEMIEILITDYEEIIKHTQMAAAIARKQGDLVTENFLLEIINRDRKSAWMIRSCKS